ncbi:hypothetical protein M407DRAFT_245124 [Tulasnella calospora MUT 4182]|uniref:C2H2-type domain-containing protein n=1 Tax=Tulasnella calospora MUT 4182 TaxID=1051891 RepID=A0A0C3QBL2_9AGAM|nr:hypothetical protein M407DRAFT_245124 [Tulasnella calospora MUT 4182]
MSQCLECGKTLASPAGLRRHINSQHQRNEWHVCECGRQFLDPAGRSRCRARHAKSFGCPVHGCSYTSSRKDSVKQHMRRRHPNSTGIHIRTLPPNLGPARSRQSSNSSLEYDPSPPPDHLLPPHHNPALMHPPLGATAFPPSLYYTSPGIFERVGVDDADRPLEICI